MPESRTSHSVTEALLIRRAAAIGLGIGGLFCVIGGFYFRLFWNEGSDSERGFGANTQEFFSPNNFGTVSKLGVPIFDLSTGVGHRLPANHGLQSTGFVLLRHILPAELIVLLAMMAALTLALTTMNLLLVVKGSTDRLKMVVADIILLSPFYLYLVSYDYYFNSIGYCVLMAATVILFAPWENDSLTSSPQVWTALLAAGMLCVAIGATVGASWIIFVILPFSVIRARAMVRAVRFLRLHHSLRLTLLGAIGCLVVAYGLLVLRLIALREFPVRVGYESFLVSLDGTWVATKHTIGKLLVNDVPGFAELLDLGFGLGLVDRFLTGHFRLPNGTVIGILALLLRMLVANRYLRDIWTWMIVLLGAIILCTLPRDWLPIGVTYRDIYLLVPFILSTTLIASSPKQPISAPILAGLRRQGPNLVKTMWVVIAVSWIFWGVNLRTRSFSNFSPTENGVFTSIVKPPDERFATLLDSVGHQRGFRIMTVTDRFRYEAFEQGRSVHYYGIYAWEDLTEHSIPTLPYINRLQAISLLAPYSHLNGRAEMVFGADSPRDRCQSTEFEFLGVQSLIVDENYLRACGSPDRNLQQLPDPDHRLLGPVYITRPASWRVFGSDMLSSESCPFMFENCIEQLGWRAYASSGQAHPPVQVLNPDTNDGVVARFFVPNAKLSGPRFLVIPIIADPAIRVTEATTGRKVVTTSAAGFLAVDLTVNDSLSGITLEVSARPDIDMWMVALAPWVWTGFLIVALSGGLRTFRGMTKETQIKQVI